MVTHTVSAIEDNLISYFHKKKLVDIIDQLTPVSVFRLNTSDVDIVDMFLENSETFDEAVRRAVFSILQQKYPTMNVELEFKNISIELTVEDEIKLHSITPEFENTPIQFVCEVIGMDERKTYITESYVVCPKCFNEEFVRADFYKHMNKTYCSNSSCKKAQMEPDRLRTKTDYVQTLLIQEPLEEAQNNSPVIFTAKVYGKHIGKVFVGQKKKVTGIFKSIATKTEENDIIIQIISMDDVERCDLIYPSDEEIAKYREDVKDGKSFITRLINSFAPDIYADTLYKDIKYAIILQLVGGVKTRKRGDINQLLVGDPSMAKSELLKVSRRLSQKSIFTSGRGASAAGLTIGIVELPNGRKVAQAGVMPLCSGGHAMIDEFDKMNKDDRSAMHEAMEQQTVSIAKAGINLTLPAQTSVMAAANPIYGNYDTDKTLAENLNLPPPLLTRFDLIWLLVDRVSEDDDTKKARHILLSYNKENDDVIFTEEQMTAYFNYVRGLKPILTQETHDRLISLYNMMRSKSKPNSITVGVRQLEALVRLSMARAKLLLKTHVGIEDVDEVTALLKSSYVSLNLDLDLADSITQQTQTAKSTKKHAALTILGIVAGIENKFELRDLKRELAKEPRFNDYEAEQMVDQLEKELLIKHNKDGSYSKSK